MSTAASTITRTPIHTRAVTYRGFARSDGLWDIEASMRDTKDYTFERFERGALQAGTPLHDMFIKVTVDSDLKIVAIETSMPATPFAQCIHAAPPVQRLIGATLGRGWRKAIESAIGGVEGCTHLRELLFNLATAAFQTIPSYIEHQQRQAGSPPPGPTEAPPYLGQCMSWRRDGPAVQRFYPQFYAARPVIGADAE